MLAEYITLAQLNDLVARGVTREMAIRIDEMPRLASASHRDGRDAAGEFSARVEFISLAKGIPGVRIAVSGDVALECQRCLEPVAWNCNADFQLAILASDEQAEDGTDIFDAVIIDEPGLRLTSVIEDELLGGLPLAPVHEERADCGELLARFGSTAGGDAAGTENRPLSELAALLGRGDQRDK